MSDSYYLVNLKTDVDPEFEVDVPDGQFQYLGMTNIHFPNAVTIGQRAFYACASIEEISLPKAETIGDYAFSGCNVTKYISLPKATAIGKSAFSSCMNAILFYAPEVRSIDDNAFSGCEKLLSVQLPVLEELGSQAFFGCSLLTNFQARNVTKIGQSAFKNCHALAEAVFPFIEKVESRTFNGCLSLSFVSLPNAKKLDGQVFQNCASLEELNLQCVENLPEGIFSGLTNLKYVNMKKLQMSWVNTPQGLESLGLDTTEGIDFVCMNGIYTDTTTPCEYLTYEEKATKQYVSGKAEVDDIPQRIYDIYADGVSEEAFKDDAQLKTIILPKAAEICNRAFQGCTNLIFAEFPNVTKTKIGEDAFKDCPNLKYIALAEITSTDAIEKAETWGLQTGCIMACSDTTVKI